MIARLGFKILLFSLLNLCICSVGNGQERVAKTINSNWMFFQGDTTQKNMYNDWARVSVPHTWNAQDVMDDEPGYYRGDGWYKKTVYVPDGWADKEVYLFFEGVGQTAEVFVNGRSVGRHIGGYTFFSFPISAYLNFGAQGNGANEVLVKVNNAHHPDISPLSGDYTFFGGLYRDVYLQVMDKVHFDADNNASTGVFLTTPYVDHAAASVQIRGAVSNKNNKEQELTVSHQILDAEGGLFAESQQMITVNGGKKMDFETNIAVQGQQLWSIENPYLYRVVSRIMDRKTGRQLDEISNPLGFRWYRFDPKEGFFLNGKHIKLIGASRHQDYKGMGNALTDAMHVRDVELLKEMGGNFLRIAHYPQDPAILQACDRLGLVAAIETPMGNQITESEAFARNAKNMLVEMIRQNYNHPSLVVWAYMNEVLLRPPYQKGSKEQELYFTRVAKLAGELEEIVRAEDPHRYTMIPNHGSFDLYNRVGLTKIPKLVGWNLYRGWYSGNFDGFGDFLDRHHRELPDKPVLVTEYGADADIRLHSFDAVRFDKTVEYTTDYHRAYLKAMLERPFVAAGLIWNLAEFSSESRGESTPHFNAKGIMTYDRKPKDGYRFYQANLLQEPYIQIGTKEWNIRTGFVESDKTLTQPVLVFSNQKKVNLKLNGETLATAETDLGVATFSVPFVQGINRLVATASSSETIITDQVDIQVQLLSQELKNVEIPFQELNISLGDRRMFFDALGAQTWLPEQPYTAGSWGYVGGEVFKMANTSRHSYGSEKNIVGTDLDPVYATQRVGIEQFRFDVPDGDYELTLHFAELLSNIEREALAYNLDSEGDESERFDERSFNVQVNGNKVLENLNNNEYLLPEHAVSFKFWVVVQNGQGIIVDFGKVNGETILNGIQLKKIR